MAETPTRPKAKTKGDDRASPTEPTPFEKMTDLTRRLVHVRKDELPNKGKPKKRKGHDT